MREANYVCPGCNGSGGVDEDRHDDIEGSVKLITTLRTRAERAEARIVELEQAAKRQAAAALAGMNATKAVSSWEMQEARRLKAECSPASVASQRDANERLTNELQAAQSTIAELTATVDAIAACLPGYLYMDPPDGGDVPLAEQVRRMSVDAAIGRKSDALRDFAKDFADEPCAYGDGCPPFAGTRHGTCMNCKARAALGE